LKRQKKKGGKLPVDLVKLAKIAISPVLGKGLAEFEVAFPFCFSCAPVKPARCSECKSHTIEVVD
jgi:hypothetical protein